MFRATVVAPPLVRNLGLLGLAGHSKNLHSPKKLDSCRHVGVGVSGSRFLA